MISTLCKLSRTSLASASKVLVPKYTCNLVPVLSAISLESPLALSQVVAPTKKMDYLKLLAFPWLERGAGIELNFPQRPGRQQQGGLSDTTHVVGMMTIHITNTLLSQNARSIQLQQDGSVVECANDCNTAPPSYIFIWSNLAVTISYISLAFDDNAICDSFQSHKSRSCQEES